MCPTKILRSVSHPKIFFSKEFSIVELATVGKSGKKNLILYTKRKLLNQKFAWTAFRFKPGKDQGKL
jgi:hypothetical protein